MACLSLSCAPSRTVGLVGGSLLPGARSFAHRNSSMRAGGFILSCASKLTRQIARMAGYRPLVAANAGNRGSCLAATSATGGRRDGDGAAVHAVAAARQRPGGAT